MNFVLHFVDSHEGQRREYEFASTLKRGPGVRDSERCRARPRRQRLCVPPRAELGLVSAM